MKIRWTFSLIAFVALTASGILEAKAQVKGTGTIGTIPKWVTTSGIGNSVISEDTSGRVLIGAPTGTAKFNVNGGLSIGVYGQSSSNYAIYGTSSGMIGMGATSTVPGGVGLIGTADGFGVRGVGNVGTGVAGYGPTGTGVRGEGLLTGVIGLSDGNAINGFSSNGNAGYFQGKVQIVANGANPGNLSVAGMLSKGGGSFKIDHPLDPENKYLYHSFVESPDMMNVYNGNITTDGNGDAVVAMPDYFEALNSEFRYQLTVIGTFAQAIIAGEMKDNRFAIKTSAPGVKVSWQVTGVRQDAWARKNRIRVEVDKPEQERGYYVHPAAFEQPEERGIEWAHNPKLMRLMNQAHDPMPKP